MLRKRRNYQEKLHLKSSFTTTSATSAKDRTDQKSFVDTRYDSNKSLANLTDDLKVESLACSGWSTILIVKTMSGKVLNIMEHSVIITKKEMEITR